ncbi:MULTISPECIES: alpha/beta hydrolase [unclassified Nonomuraea]|uniref:alpha/beta fold hydrolase n=1 Tax=unclassified Nonomuraea TaxID=2593643 RepID=UPI0033DC812C
MEIVRTLGRSLTAIGATAGAIGLASASYQTWGSLRDRLRFLPPGELINIGGRRIHLWAWDIDSPGPTTVIVPSLGTSCLDFGGLRPALQADDDEPVVIFDRAGLGWSDPVQGPQALLDAAADLYRALLRARIRPPYVLVGHSIGGYIVRLFASDHPEMVAGVVLLDSSHHDQFHRLPNYGAGNLRRYASERVRPYGLIRLAHDLHLSDSLEVQARQRCPEVWTRTWAAIELSDRHRRASLQELLTWPRLAKQVAMRAPSLGDIPLTVVSSSELSSDYVTPAQIAERRAMYKIWYPMQVELAALSKDTRHLVAEQSGHYVHRFQPGLVADAILGLVRRARSG